MNKRQPAENWILKYYQMIEDGSVTVGRWIRLLYERIIDDLENKVYFFDKKKANRAIRFFEKFCHHSKGKLAPQLVKLETWQKALISCIFGLVDENGIRVYREVFIVMGRKNGKSLLASGIAEYMSYADGERGADCFFLAPKLEQADIVFSDYWQSVSAEPDLMKITKKRKTDIYIESTNTSVKKIAFSEKKSDGFNPHLTVCDEIAAWVGDQGIKQYGVMTSALGSREQPIILSITTANYVNDGIYDELFKRGTSFLQGNSREKRLLPFLYLIDDTSKWNDLNELQKSIPNLGVSVSAAYILEEIAKAEESLANKAEFLCKMACIKQNSSQAWLNAQDVKKCFGNDLTLEDFRHTYALGGIDLSLAVDLTAAVIVIEKNGISWFDAHFFMPANKIDEATQRDGLPYRIYAQRGLLTISGENTVDYHDVRNWFRMLEREFEILPLKVGYDRYSAAYLVQDMQADGFDMESVSQGSNLTGVLIDMEGMIKDGRLRCINDNDLMKVHMLDAALKFEEGTNRRRLIKMSAKQHIDGMAALSDAICMRHNYYEELQTQLSNER
jgi:phage terminase large subunit-like protein